MFAKTDAVTAGDDAATMFVPLDLDGTRLRSVAVILSTAGSGTTVQIRNVTQAVDMLTTAVTCDSGERTSHTAATAAVVAVTDNSLVAAGDEIAVDVDVAGGTGMTVNVGFW